MDKDIVERLERKAKLAPTQGSGFVTQDGGFGYSITDDGMRLVNPDGPEAAAEILALRQRLTEVEGALGPFAKALNDWGDDTGQPDRWNTWEHPIAMNVTLGDFRRALTILQPSTKESGDA